MFKIKKNVKGYYRHVQKTPDTFEKECPLNAKKASSHEFYIFEFSIFDKSHPKQMKR